MKMKNWSILLGFALLLSGCSGFSLKSSAPPMTLYRLQAAPPALQAGPPQRIIAIAEPVVPPGFESERIAVYLEQGRRMDYAAGAAWPGPFPKVLQDFMVQSAATVPGLLGVTSDSGLPATAVIVARVNDFEPVYTTDAKSAPMLKESMTFMLEGLDGRRSEPMFTLTGEIPASANTLMAITAGLQTLAQNLTAQAFQKITPVLREGRPNARHRK